MRYAIENSVLFDFLYINGKNWKSLFDGMQCNKNVHYIRGLENLKKKEREEFLDITMKYEVIVSAITTDAIAFPKVIDISFDNIGLDIGNEILSIKEYERVVIARFESRYNDQELAKKLGISRKSLWEKRKKYGISRKNKHT